MPYLYQDSKPRPAAHPGAARGTHSSGKGYEQLKQECLRRGVLFEDPDFPACTSSLFFSENPPIPFVWKRPGVSMPLCSCPESGSRAPGFSCNLGSSRAPGFRCAPGFSRGPRFRCNPGLHQVRGAPREIGDDEVWQETLPTSGAAAQGWDATCKELKLQEERAGRLHAVFRV